MWDIYSCRLQTKAVYFFMIADWENLKRFVGVLMDVTKAMLMSLPAQAISIRRTDIHADFEVQNSSLPRQFLSFFLLAAIF
jgi:hypothetical protein